MRAFAAALPFFSGPFFVARFFVGALRRAVVFFFAVRRFFVARRGLPIACCAMSATA